MSTSRRFAVVPILALLMLLAVAAALRLWRIDSLPPGFHFDESFEGLEAWRILTDPSYRPVFLTGNFGVAPLNSYANAVTFALFQFFGGEAGPTAMRVTAAVAGLLGVLAVFAVGDEMRRYDPRLSPAYPFLAAAVLAVMRWHVHFSRLAIEPIYVPLEWALATWLLLRGWRTGSLLSFAGCGAVLAASMYTYQGAWVIPILVAVTALMLLAAGYREQRGRARSESGNPPCEASRRDGGAGPSNPAIPQFRNPAIPQLFLAGLVAFALVAPLAWFMWHNPDLLLLRPSQIAITGAEGASATGFWHNAWASAKMFFPFGETGDLDPRRNLPGAPALSVWLAVPFWIGLGMALWRIRVPVYAALIVGLLGLLFPGMISEYAPHFHRILGAAAPAALLAALPLAWLWHIAAFPPFRRALVLLTLVLAAVTTTRDYFVRWAALPDLFYAFDQGLWDAGQWIAAQPAETPIYLTPRGPEHPTLAFAWRTGAGGHPAPASFDGRAIFPLRDGSTGRDEYYVVIEHEDFRTPLLLPEVLPQALVEYELLDDTGRVYARAIKRPASTVSAAAPRHIVDAPLGDGIRLWGYTTIPDTPKPGEILYMRLYWIVTDQPAGDWTVYTHLQGPEQADGNTLWAGHDARPGNGSLPTNRWQPGWQVIDEYPVAMPSDLPPGTYTLTTGLYQPSGERLPADGSELRLGKVQVVTGE